MTADGYYEGQAGLALARLCGWYTLQCNGDWEHGVGIRISTLDNPGWMLRINLDGTSCQARHLKRSTTQRTEHDWIVSETKDVDGCHSYCSYGGPVNLPEMIIRFVDWASEPHAPAHSEADS